MFNTEVSKQKACGHSHLYHHTKWDTLFYFLCGKTLRLSRINEVCNDDNEYMRLEDDWWRQYYVACFTYRSEEYDYFWNEYGDKLNPQTTIRIGFTNKFSNFGTPYYSINGVNFEIPCIADEWENVRNKVSYEYIFLKQVLYSDKLANDLGAKSIDGGGHATYNHAGMVKHEKWSHEKECRLHMKVFNMLPTDPFLPKDKLENIEKLHGIKIPTITHSFGKKSIDIPYIYLPLSDELLSNIEVVFSPYMGDSLKEMIRSKVVSLGFEKCVTFRDSALRFS